VFDYNKNIGTTFSYNPSIGDVGCGWGMCFGAEASLYLSGSIGLNVGAHVDSGSVSASIPFTSTVDAPTAVFIGTTITPSAAIGLGPSSFTTTGPTAGAFAEFYASIYAAGSAEACFFGCTGTSGVLFNAAFTQELLALNRNNDGELRILGNEVPLSGSVGPVTYAFNPAIQGATASGYGTIAGTASTDVADVGVDLAAVVADAVGIPISGTLQGVLDWSLLSASATLDTYFNQSFSFTPSVAAQLHVEETGQDIWCLTGLGCDPFTAPMTSGMLTITPHYYATGLFSNDTGLVLAPGYDIGLLSASIPGFFSIGPVFQWSNQFPLPEISVYQNSFELQGFQQIEGASFQIQVVPEPYSILLVGTGFLVAARLLRRQTRRG
jgi:hypothetical protein